MVSDIFQFSFLLMFILATYVSYIPNFCVLSHLDIIIIQ